MAHELEMREDGTANMAFAGEVPWHGLGKNVPHDVTPEQMLQAAGLDWTVRKIPAFAMVGEEKVAVGRSALVRSVDNRVLDVVGDDWNPVQNQEAAEFFNDFVAAGDMNMETAGSLRNGQIVWFLARVNESFELFNGDKVDGYLLFTNPHKFGQTTSVQFNPIRVVCANTLAMAFEENVQNIVRISHRREFNAGNVKEMLGIAKHKLDSYKETAKFLGSRKTSKENIVEYFQRIFPVISSKEETRKEMSKSAGRLLNILETQPGREYAEGSWWQAFNAVTYGVDHVIGRSVDTRLSSSWYGVNRQKKIEALKLAVDYAEKSPELISA